MKIKARPGEFFFKALIPIIFAGREKIYQQGYELSQKYYGSEEEAKRDHTGAIWPAEMIDRECVYVPTKEEMEEDF